MNDAARDDAILSARGIVNRFGSHRVHDHVALDIHAGEIFGIAGGSGSGKSVLLKTLAGLHRPNAGEVRLAGRKVQSIGPSERAALIGVLFQQGALFSSLSVANNVMLPLREHSNLAPEDQASVAAMKLELAGLASEDGARLPAELSGGMVKRAALARALALDPRILFLDEPTSGLDPITADGIDALIADLNHGLGVTVVIVTHDLNTLLGLCGRIAVLVDRQVHVDTPEALVRSNQPWIRDFFHGPRAQGILGSRRKRHGNG